MHFTDLGTRDRVMPVYSIWNMTMMDVLRQNTLETEDVFLVYFDKRGRNKGE